LADAGVEQVFAADAELCEGGQVDRVDLHKAQGSITIGQLGPNRAGPAARLLPGDGLQEQRVDAVAASGLVPARRGSLVGPLRRGIFFG
jgi:hypothetical protein